MAEDYSGWPDKEQVAQTLGVAKKTVERLAAKGDLRQVELHVSGRRPLPVYDPADVERIRLQTVQAATVKAVETEPTKTGKDVSPDVPIVQAKPRTALQRAEAPQVGRFLEIIATALAGPGIGPLREGEKLLLTLPECSASTGLSETHLARAARDGRLKGRKVGGAWRVEPAALRGYVADLMAGRFDLENREDE